MKKLLLASLCICTGLIAGQNESKLEKLGARLARLKQIEREKSQAMEMEEQRGKSTQKMPCVDSSAEDVESEESGTSQAGPQASQEEFKPFGGSDWANVYIADDEAHSIYTFYNIRCNNSVKKWDFDGNASTECTLDNQSKKLVRAYFTDYFCYLEGNDTIDIQGMDDSYHKNIQMKESIKKLMVCKAGFATYTTDNYLTVFDPQGNPKGDPIRVDETKCKGIGMLDSGEPIYYDSDTLSMVDVSNNESSKEVTLKNIPYRIHPQKINNKQLLLACDHKTIANKEMIQVINSGSGHVDQSIPIKSIYLKQWDLDGNHVATAGDGHKGSTIKLFDLERGKQIYSGIAKNIGGVCALRLKDNLIYFVGDKPKPQSMIIDTREKSACNG